MDSTTRFGSRASAYAAFRPSYPPEAIDAVLEGLGDPRAVTIADVGAGTGISSRLFAERGAALIAIEPNARMRATARGHRRAHRFGRCERGCRRRVPGVPLVCNAHGHGRISPRRARPRGPHAIRARRG